MSADAAGGGEEARDRPRVARVAGQAPVPPGAARIICSSTRSSFRQTRPARSSAAEGVAAIASPSAQSASARELDRRVDARRRLFGDDVVALRRVALLTCRLSTGSIPSMRTVRPHAAESPTPVDNERRHICIVGCICVSACYRGSTQPGTAACGPRGNPPAATAAVEARERLPETGGRRDSRWSPSVSCLASRAKVRF